MSWQPKSLYLSDPEGNVYEIPGEAISQFRVSDDRKGALMQDLSGDEVAGYQFGPVMFIPGDQSGVAGIDGQSITVQPLILGPGGNFDQVSFGAASQTGY